MAPEGEVPDSAMPVESGIPKMNAKKINRGIEKSNKKSELKTPLTTFNLREK